MKLNIDMTMKTRLIQSILMTLFIVIELVMFKRELKGTLLPIKEIFLFTESGFSAQWLADFLSVLLLERGIVELKELGNFKDHSLWIHVLFPHSLLKEEIGDPIGSRYNA